MRLPQAVFFNKPDFLLSEIICINQIYIMRGKNNLTISVFTAMNEFVLQNKLHGYFLSSQTASEANPANAVFRQTLHLISSLATKTSKTPVSILRSISPM